MTRRPFIIVLVLAMVASFTALGLWQLERAEEKQRLLDTFAERAAADAVSLGALSGEPSQAAHRRVEVSGTFWKERQILRDNRIHDGRAGYHVITPFFPADVNAVLLINRGWIPWGQRREELPRFDTPAGQLRLSGTLRLPPEDTMVLGPEEPHGGTWPRIVQTVDLAELTGALGRDLLPYVLLLDPEAPAGFVRQWSPLYGGIGPEKHRAYALQWFTFATLMLVLSIAAARRGAREDGDGRA
ncbi:MAG: SURF1 family protein [Gammaproteobacteria bacterium]|nr:SURF1 family protein [Gammaproteobacteria bacterium]